MKKASTLKNMLLSLGIISLVAGLCLGGVYVITEAPIAQAKIAKQVEALKIVLPDFDNDILSTKRSLDIDGSTIDIFEAKLAENIVGTAVNTFSKNGFGGMVRLMVGILPDGTIKSIKVLQHTETPGLGDKMDDSKSNFSHQFNGVNASNFTFKVKKDGGDVDAITAATISSRAFCDAVERAVKAVSK